MFWICRQSKAWMESASSLQLQRKESRHMPGKGLPPVWDMLCQFCYKLLLMILRKKAINDGWSERDKLLLWFGDIQLHYSQQKHALMQKCNWTIMLWRRTEKYSFSPVLNGVNRRSFDIWIYADYYKKLYMKMLYVKEEYGVLIFGDI